MKNERVKITIGNRFCLLLRLSVFAPLRLMPNGKYLLALGGDHVNKDIHRSAADHSLFAGFLGRQ
jgi:hypothetical protein